jgi:hypothetical protein
MSDQQARFLRDDVYDHEHEEPRSSGGRRRRPVADWGVDDVFDHVPRRRFSRAAEGPPRDRGFSRAEEHRAARAPSDERAPEAEPEVPRGRVDDGRRTLVIGRAEDLPSEIAAVTADRDLGEHEPPVVRAPGERRTVKIGGRPEGSLEAARFHRDFERRRPPRPAHERLGARPERLAAWAVALGMLLILIAILTAH